MLFLFFKGGERAPCRVRLLFLFFKGGEWAACGVQLGGFVAAPPPPSPSSRAVSEVVFLGAAGRLCRRFKCRSTAVSDGVQRRPVCGVVARARARCVATPGLRLWLGGLAVLLAAPAVPTRRPACGAEHQGNDTASYSVPRCLNQHAAPAAVCRCAGQIVERCNPGLLVCMSLSCRSLLAYEPLRPLDTACRPDCGAVHGGGGRAHGLASPPGKQGLSNRIEWLPVQPAGALACAGLCRRLRSCRRCLTGTPSCCFPAFMCFCFHVPCRPTARTAPRSRRCGCEHAGLPNPVARQPLPSVPATSWRLASNAACCAALWHCPPASFSQSPPLSCPHVLPRCLLHAFHPDV